MILIADSGSTKCNWVLCEKNGSLKKEINTIGFNPYFIDQPDILFHLNNSRLSVYKDNIENIFFYGAGCSSEDKNQIIEEALQIFFKDAKIIIKHDVEAACYATYNGNPNITCILGTGSNSCYYDGKNITENAPSLGFLLGDEASGNYFGKKILTLYFNKVLPEELINKFESKFENNISVIKKNIYSNSKANVYLAKYFPFISENRNHPMIQDLILNTLDDFFNLHILCYKNYKEAEINFIGSVAYFLSEEINLTLKKYKCKKGVIIKRPINNLVNYHFNNDKLSAHLCY